EIVDCIVLLDIIEHLINPTIILDEAKRSLKKGGLLIITTPNLAMLYNRIFLLFGWSFSNYHTCIYKTGNPFLKIKNVGNLWNENAHKSVFTFEELKELIKDVYKFNILGLTGFSYSNTFATGSDSTYGGFRKYLNWVIPNSLKEGILLIAKK
ncbi:MAG: methyltransferase domain-containing protein, partial [Candidatus Diapherotrites archaeon]|nr:methyltransferase domain-containing protein [Candidatus Diapherotrites archaeon]